MGIFSRKVDENPLQILGCVIMGYPGITNVPFILVIVFY